MTRKEAAGVIKFEKACVLRQDTPRCNRDCKKCDLLLPTEDVLTAYDMAIKALEQEPCEDTISRQAAIDAMEESKRIYVDRRVIIGKMQDIVSNLPSAQPELRYTEEELRVFAHGISLSLLSKRSAQHWQYDKDTATEIEFLEQLYDKVSADMKGRQG